MKRWHKSFDWNSMRQYTKMQPAARLLFHGIYAMLQGRPYVEADIPQLKCWLTLDRDYVRRALPGLNESGLLVIEELPGGEYRFSLSDELAELCGVSRVRSDDVVSTQRVRSDGVASTKRVRSDDVASTKRVRSVASSNDAGLKPANLPLEENRIEKNRKEESRIDAQSAADKPLNSPSSKVKKSTTTVERPDGCDEVVWADWLRVRGKNPLTQTAWAGMTSEASKAGISPAEAVRICAERGWRGFRADWLANDKAKRNGRYEPEDLSKQDYRSHDGDDFVAGSAAEYFYGKDYVRRARERYEKPYDRSKEELA